MALRFYFGSVASGIQVGFKSGLVRRRQNDLLGLIYRGSLLQAGIGMAR